MAEQLEADDARAVLWSRPDRGGASVRALDAALG